MSKAAITSKRWHENLSSAQCHPPIPLKNSRTVILFLVVLIIFGFLVVQNGSHSDDVKQICNKMCAFFLRHVPVCTKHSISLQRYFSDLRKGMDELNAELEGFFGSKVIDDDDKFPQLDSSSKDHSVDCIEVKPHTVEFNRTISNITHSKSKNNEKKALILLVSTELSLSDDQFKCIFDSAHSINADLQCFNYLNEPVQLLADLSSTKHDGLIVVSSLPIVSSCNNIFKLLKRSCPIVFVDVNNQQRDVFDSYSNIIRGYSNPYHGILASIYGVFGSDRNFNNTS